MTNQMKNSPRDFDDAFPRSLKEEYAARKQDQSNTQKLYLEAIDLLESNNVLILEKLDTAAIEKISGAMAAIERALGPTLSKLPALSTALKTAEGKLAAGASGKLLGPDLNKTLAQVLALYKGLAEFFTTDIPKLLTMPMFKDAAAKAGAAGGNKVTEQGTPTSIGNPTAPAPAPGGFPQAPGSTNDTLAATVPGGEKVLVPIFTKALATEKGGILGGLMSKMAGWGNNLPFIKNVELAKQLTTLSFKELQNLATVGHIPAVTSTVAVADQVAKDVAQSAPQQATAAAGTPAASAAAATANPEVALSQRIDQMGGVAAIGKLIQTNQISDSGTLAKLLLQQQAAAAKK